MKLRHFVTSPKAKTLLGAYLALLAISEIYRFTRPPLRPLGDLQAMTMADGIRLAYADSAPNAQDKPVVLLIHGSPGDSSVLRKLGTLLEPKFRVLIPDLPGFGASSQNIPDYSFAAHARYLEALVTKLQIPQAHLVGFSMGGGVVLSMAADTPQKTQSLTLLSAIGVQEHELTGSYSRNHFIHGVQLVAITLARDLTPHFGLFDNWMFDYPYARNFYDSDQRPLRAVLEAYRGPMLILHGDKDPMVPLSAAQEHHRIVKQSELVIYPTNHFMAFLQPNLFAARLEQFLLQSGKR